MNIGNLCLALYLIVVGLLTISNINFVWSGPITGLLAIVAGICLLIGK